MSYNIRLTFTHMGVLVVNGRGVVFVLSHGDLTRMGIIPEVLDIVVWIWIINMAHEKLFYEIRNPRRRGSVKKTIEEESKKHKKKREAKKTSQRPLKY
jgi:hypothetical protein